MEIPSTYDIPVNSIPITSIPASHSRPVRTAKYAEFTGTPNVLTSVNSNSISSVQYPLHHYMSHHVFTPKYQAFLNKVDATTIPYTYSQAAVHPEWLPTMKDEIHALESNQTWKIVPLPADKQMGI